MRIVVDLNRCLGYAQCVPLAPEVLQLQGEEALAYDPNPDDSQRQQVARAVGVLPGAGDHRGDGPARGQDDEVSTHPLVDELVRTFKAEGRIVIVGASLAGLRAAEALRDEGFAGSLTLIGDEVHEPYDRPPLSKQVLKGWVPARTPSCHGCARSTPTGALVWRRPDWTAITGKCSSPTATRCPTTGC